MKLKSNIIVAIRRKNEYKEIKKMTKDRLKNGDVIMFLKKHIRSKRNKMTSDETK